MIITIENLSFSYGINTIFENTSFAIDDNEKIGLIGSNGSGKSTLFKLITGELKPEGGNIHQRADLKIGYLKQTALSPEEGTLRDVMRSVFNPIIELAAEIDKIRESLDTLPPEEQMSAVQKLSDMEEDFVQRGGYEYPGRIRGVVKGLGFTDADMEKPVSSFSGGQKTRIALGTMLLQNPDLLLLDEPTNYLDFDTMAWLENYLKNEAKTFIVISHDRYFLNKICTRIAEIENHRIISFKGDYTAYLSKKAKRDTALKAKIKKNNQEIKRQQHIIDDLRSRHSIKSMKRAKSRETKLEKMTTMREFSSPEDIRFQLTPKIRSADDVLKVDALSKSFGDHLLFSDISFDVFRGDRIGIIGPNGIGKTTLIKILFRQIASDSGKMIFGPKVYPGYYSQEGTEITFSDSETLIDIIREGDISLTDGEIRNLLARFLFTGDDVFKNASELSGGELARVRLALLMISEANFLLLDEPTNHIDISTKEIIEDALSSYDGTIIAVSHDRYFLNRVANRIFCLTKDGLLQYEGNYDDYVERKLSQASEDNGTVKPHVTKTEMRKQKKEEKAERVKKQNLKKQLKQLEKTIEQTDERIASIENDMCQSDFYNDANRARALTEEYDSLKIKSEELLNEWEKTALLIDEG